MRTQKILVALLEQLSPISIVFENELDQISFHYCEAGIIYRLVKGRTDFTICIDYNQYSVYCSAQFQTVENDGEWRYTIVDNRRDIYALEHFLDSRSALKLEFGSLTKSVFRSVETRNISDVSAYLERHMPLIVSFAIAALRENRLRNTQA
jgi:hypothetical protein